MFNDQAFSNPLSLACSNFLWAGPGAGGYVDNLSMIKHQEHPMNAQLWKCAYPPTPFGRFSSVLKCVRNGRNARTCTSSLQCVLVNQPWRCQWLIFLNAASIFRQGFNWPSGNGTAVATPLNQQCWMECGNAAIHFGQKLGSQLVQSDERW